MYETADELAALQRLIDDSFDRAGAHLTSIVTPQRRLPAVALVGYAQGVRHLAVATVTSAGAPLVSAVDGLLLHGSWWFSTSTDSVKARHLAVRPAISAAHVVGDDLGVFVHGTATLVRGGTDEAAALAPMWRAVYDGGCPEDWTPTPQQALYVRIDAHTLITYVGGRPAAEPPPG